MGARSVLVLAELADAEREAIEQDCQNCNFDVTWLTSAETVAAKLISGRFDALLVHLQTPGAARACVEARKTLTRVRFPIMALADHVDDSTFSKAFRVGVDDVIDLTASAKVSQRLVAIPRASWKPAARSRGEALIVDPDNGRAESLARLLKEAGYLIKNARDEPSARLHLWRQSIRLVVVDNSVQETARWIREGNGKEWHPIWIVRARPDQMDEISEQLYAFTNASAVNVYLGDADVLYEANRLSAAYESRRAAAALLFYGTTVTFSTGSASAIDGQWIEHGSTYSVDVNEIAVRTLALPPSTELELSLTPPGQVAPITLQADVTQRRVFGAVQDQSAPPGFTARLSGESLAIWNDAIRAAGRQRFGPKWTPSGETGPTPAQANQANTVSASPTASEASPKSSEPRGSGPVSSVEPTSPSPTTPPTAVAQTPSAASGSGGPPSSQPASSQPASSQPASSRPASSQPASSQPASSQPRSSKPTSSEPPSSGRGRPSSPDSGDGVPIARVRLVSAGANAQGGGRGAAPTLKSLNDEAAEALAAVNDPEVPSTTPSRIEQDASEPEKTAQSVIAKDSVDRAPNSSGGSAPNDSRSPAEAVVSRAAQPQLQEVPGAPPPQTRVKVVAVAGADAPNVETPAPKRKAGWLTFALVLIAVAGFAALASRRQPPAPPAVPTSAPLPAAEELSPASPTTPAHSSAPVLPPATASAGSVASESPGEAASAAPIASEAAQGHPDAAPQPPKDPSELAGHLGYLYVSSPIDTQVFVQGKAAGKTNSYLEVFCGRRYLRLGTAPGEWQSDGVGFKISCQRVNRITLRPK